MSEAFVAGDELEGLAGLGCQSWQARMVCTPSCLLRAAVLHGRRLAWAKYPSILLCCLGGTVTVSLAQHLKESCRGLADARCERA
jgi:hypothetical protein